MAEISTITSTLKSLLSSQLGAEYSEIAHATVIEKNTFKGGKKRYGVLPKEMAEVDGVLKHYTIDQAFDIVLTDSYGGKALSDLDKQTKTIEIQEKLFELYQHIINTKAGSPSIVIHTNGFSTDEPEYFEDDHVVAITATVTIKYRKQL